VPGLAPALVRVVQRALSKDRTRRQASAAQLAEELRLACPEAGARTNLLSPARDDSRRQFPRAPYNTPVRVVTGRGAVDGRSHDVSEGGILFQAMTACRVGEEVLVRFGLPMDGKVAACTARVCWVRGDENPDDSRPRVMGLAFVDAPADVRRSIARYVALMSTMSGTLSSDEATPGEDSTGHDSVSHRTLADTPIALANGANGYGVENGHVGR
jgi:uncharacterized protein (TIGR02266 family)